MGLGCRRQATHHWSPVFYSVSMFGILNINKPAGWTSRDVVNRVQRLVRGEKVGHAGTLDPLATGVLLVAVGPATRLIQFAHLLPKSYRASFLLGQQSVSDDVETEVELLANPPIPSVEDIEEILPQFLGTIQQRPPMYSAIKVDGQRAYRLARQGKDVELAPRPVVIHTLELIHYDYPEIALDIHCGSGTYVRSLGRDIAESLGSAAVMSGLERTSTGNMGVTSALELDDLVDDIEHFLQPPTPLVDALSRIVLSADEICELHHGRAIAQDLQRVQSAPWQLEEPHENIAGFDGEGRIVAILRTGPDDTFRPACNFPLSE